MAIKVEGVQGLQRSLDILAKKYGNAKVEGAVVAAQLVRGEAIRSIQLETMGAYQTRTNASGNQRQVIASRPGDAPNTDTGRLVSSIQVDATTGFFYGTAIFVGTSLEYGKWLEFGTRRMNARPWLYPALERKRKEIQKIFTLKIEAVTRKGLK